MDALTSCAELQNAPKVCLKCAMSGENGADRAKSYTDPMGEGLNFNYGARPQLKAYVDSIADYDTVFVCFPCWCGTAPMCLFTFLEHYDWTGKKVLPLCTNEGSGLAKAPQDIASACAGAVIGDGLSVRGHQVKDSEEIITAWAKENL